MNENSSMVHVMKVIAFSFGYVFNLNRQQCFNSPSIHQFRASSGQFSSSYSQLKPKAVNLQPNNIGIWQRSYPFTDGAKLKKKKSNRKKKEKMHKSSDNCDGTSMAQQSMAQQCHNATHIINFHFGNRSICPIYIIMPFQHCSNLIYSLHNSVNKVQINTLPNK